MATAAKNLTPVTLELGGKSPTILAEDFDVKTAVERILYAKLMNAGQTCVAPDYLFVPEGKQEAVVQMAKTIVSHRYPTLETRDYTSIIDQKAYLRLMTTLEDARDKNAQIINLIPGPQANDELQKISPCVVTAVNEEMILMQAEIFGPLLPIMTYRSLDEVIAYINAHDRPLALYAFSNDRIFLDKLIKHTRSGGVTINDCAMHVAQHDLPFGGIGNSGMGQYHGYEGFAEFSKLRPVFKQAKRALRVAPPYGASFDRLYKLIKRIKWIA
jgi:coniferyl-aldehyde dehydrogenase